MLPGPNLQSLREKIEEVDRELLGQLRLRMELVEDVAKAKLRAASPYRDQHREDQVLQRVRRMAVQHGLDAHAIERLYRQIMEMSISHQQAYVQALESVPLRIAYQGVEGSYSHLTAQRRYAGRKSGALLSGFETVREVAGAVRSGHADVAILPIENSTAGSINETYDILTEGGLHINAEMISQIEHCLITLPGVSLEELRKVISHPQALLQCETYLRSVPWIRPEAEFDTAGAAHKVKEQNDRKLAAIASESAANLLGLQVLRSGIQTQPGNSTRFVEVALEASPCPSDLPCKTSLLAVLDQNSANLGTVLMELGRRNIQLSKLESRPIPTSPWKYRFYLDVEAHGDSAAMGAACDAIRPLTTELRSLGTYPKAEVESRS